MFEKYSVQQSFSEQLQTHVWTIPLIIELFSHILNADVVVQVFAMHFKCTSGVAGHFCLMFCPKVIKCERI